uniref:Uncharacterized protein n=1 Tax=Peronospora matthiolae TaxID=2874970 RepID=A0AAV1VL54_9STRA
MNFSNEDRSVIKPTQEKWKTAKLSKLRGFLCPPTMVVAYALVEMHLSYAYLEESCSSFAGHNVAMEAGRTVRPGRLVL